MAEYIERAAALYEIERREALMGLDKRVSVTAMKSFIKNRPAAGAVQGLHLHTQAVREIGVQIRDMFRMHPPRGLLLREWHEEGDTKGR